MGFEGRIEPSSNNEFAKAEKEAGTETMPILSYRRDGVTFEVELDVVKQTYQIQNIDQQYDVDAESINMLLERLKPTLTQELHDRFKKLSDDFAGV